MSDFRDRFERQLVAAAERLPATAPARPPDARPRWRRPPSRPLALLLATLALAGGTAVATVATHPWSPRLGDSHMRGPRPRIAVDAPPPEQLAMLGVLRRKPTAADHGPAVRATLSYLSAQGYIGVRTDWIRRLDHSGGAAVTLIPVALARPWWGSPVRDALCVFIAEPNGDGGASKCWATRDVRAGRAVLGLGSRAIGIVPDGVARVVLHMRGGADEPVTVTDNFFEYDGSSRAPGEPGLPDSITWLDALGAEVPKG